MTQSRPYHRAEVEQILTAYRTLFPEATALATYWDFGRKRPWSCLTTDFHRATPESVAAFDESVRKLAIAQTDPLSRGEALRDLSLAHGVGYSLGISPWTDDLLLRTFTPRTKRVILVLGHDWYPIVTADLGYQATPPLDRFSVFDEPKYGEAVPSSLWADGETAVLFMNLYPDFRPPAMDVMGSLGDYGPWLRGLEAVCTAVSRTFEIRAIVSWGANVWEVVSRQLGRPWKDLGVMAAVTRQQEGGKPLELRLGDRAYDYYAFAHPSFTPNFKRPAHAQAYRQVMATLGR